MGFLQHRDQIRQETVADGLVVDEREQFLELVDDQDHPRIVIGKNPEYRAQESGVVVSELVLETVWRVDRRSQQRCLDLGERVRAGHHPGDQPLVRTGQRPLRQRRDEAGANDARLARSTRSDQRHEGVAAECSEHLSHEGVAPEELGSIRLEERPQPLEWVDDLESGSTSIVSRDRQALKLFVMEQDPLLQPPQLGRRLDAQLLAGLPTEPAERA